MGRKILKLCGLCLVTAVVFIAVLIVWLLRPLEEQDETINALDSRFLIAHAGGTIEGQTYTNSREALLSSLDKGFRYIEIDLYMTTDSNVVCLHELKDYNRMTSSDYNHIDTETFQNNKLYGRYTPMTLEDAVRIWEERPFFFVIDKISSPQILNSFFRKNRDMVFVEAFTLDDYIQLEKDGYNPILTRDGNIKGLIWFLVRNLVYGNKVSRIATCPVNDLFLRIYKNMDVKVAMFTINDEGYLNSHIGKYVDFIYTDFIEPHY